MLTFVTFTIALSDFVLNLQIYSMTNSLFKDFLTALSPACRARVTDKAALMRSLEGLVRSARRRWPTITLETAEFFRALAVRVPEDADPLATLSLLHTDDIYLATACLGGDLQALSLFKAEHLRFVAPAISRLALSPEAVQDVQQTLGEKLLSGPSPLLSNYSGSGRLSGWIRVVALRTGMRYIEKRDKERPTDQAYFERLVSGNTDIELEYMKQLYQREFKEAFATAWKQLEAEQRTLLRQHVIDGVSIQGLAALYRVHKATPARWLQRARADLLRFTRAAMIEKLQINPRGFESVIRLIESRLDITIRLLVDNSE